MFKRLNRLPAMLIALLCIAFMGMAQAEQKQQVIGIQPRHLRGLDSERQLVV